MKELEAVFSTRSMRYLRDATIGKLLKPCFLCGPCCFPEVKRQTREAANSPLSSAEFKNDGAITQFPIRLRGMSLLN
jgi:hypothetical protein